MKKLYVLNDIYEAERIAKTNRTTGEKNENGEDVAINITNIIGYNGNDKIFEFPNITNENLGNYILEDGQKWDIDEIEQLKLEKNILAQSIYDLTTIIEAILLGGIE